MAAWVAQRLKEDPIERTIGILDLCIHPKRKAEATSEMIEEINNLSDQDAVQALLEIRRARQYVRGRMGNHMNLDVNLQTLEDGRHLEFRCCWTADAQDCCCSLKVFRLRTWLCHVYKKKRSSEESVDQEKEGRN